MTICAFRRENLFGSIVGAAFVPNAIGKIIAEEWLRTAELRDYVGLDAFVVMPNHLHGIITILDEENMQNDRQEPAGTVKRERGKLAAGSLGAIVGRVKGSVTRRVHESSTYRDQIVWQRNYHDHIIRNEKSLQAIREYIVMNPSRWADDSYFNENGSDLIRS